jgi:type IV pilus modification protein PilV
MNKKFSKIKRACLLVLIRRSKSARQGFSLIEVLVSLFVLSIGITAIAVLMVDNIKNLQTSKNQIVASQLAQEGIELVRNLKDNSSDPVINGFIAGNYNNYRIDKDMLSVNSTNNDGEQLLYLNGSFGSFYTHTTGSPTKFFRRIDFIVSGSALPAPSSRQIKATCYVTWNNTGFLAMSLPADCNVANKCVSVVSVLPDEN